jgi:hypothetical protein
MCVERPAGRQQQLLPDATGGQWARAGRAAGEQGRASRRGAPAELLDLVLQRTHTLLERPVLALGAAVLDLKLLCVRLGILKLPDELCLRFERRGPSCELALWDALRMITANVGSWKCPCCGTAWHSHAPPTSCAWKPLMYILNSSWRPGAIQLACTPLGCCIVVLPARLVGFTCRRERP